MSMFSGIKFKPKDIFRKGTPFVQLLHQTMKDFNEPSVNGLSDAERKALDEKNLSEDARRKRLLEAQQRRTRVALGLQGGSRSLMFGGYTGTTTPATLGSASQLGTV